MDRGELIEGNRESLRKERSRGIGLEGRAEMFKALKGRGLKGRGRE